MFDVIVIGLGCAGYTSAIYCARYKLNTLIVGEIEGGMGMTAAEVGNWPGEIDIKGPDLMEKFKAHALSFDNVTHKALRVVKVEAIEGGLFRIAYQDGNADEARAIIFATGSDKRHLGIPGEKEFSGKGVTYCATCDAFFYKGKDVAVIGGGDSAVEGAAIAAQVARKVYLIYRKKGFKAEPYWVDEVKKKQNVEFVPERNVAEVLGDKVVSSVRLDKEYNGSDEIKVSGVFIEIGSLPSVDLAIGIGCDLDDRGYIKVADDMATNVKGIFAAGDVAGASNHFSQFTTAAGEGAVAANGVFGYLQMIENQ